MVETVHPSDVTEALRIVVNRLVGAGIDPNTIVHSLLKVADEVTERCREIEAAPKQEVS
ncbi:hypothetical protein [Enterovirga aerilata]|nr:hypothetical protein [Enterovirga sp. DB1703]